MYETLVTPRGPAPNATYKGPDTLPPPQWRVLKSRMKRVEERFGDLQRHPWVGERQAGRARNQYNMTAMAVDADLRKVPYGERLRMPAGGAFPLVQGMEIGTGPNPWLDTPWLQQAPAAARSGGFRLNRGDMRHDKAADGDAPAPQFILRNTGAEVDPGRYEDGPASAPPAKHSAAAAGPNVKDAALSRVQGGGISKGKQPVFQGTIIRQTTHKATEEDKANYERDVRLARTLTNIGSGITAAPAAAIGGLAGPIGAAMAGGAAYSLSNKAWRGMADAYLRVRYGRMTT